MCTGYAKPHMHLRWCVPAVLLHPFQGHTLLDPFGAHMHKISLAYSRFYIYLQNFKNSQNFMQSFLNLENMGQNASPHSG